MIPNPRGTGQCAAFRTSYAVVGNYVGREGRGMISQADPEQQFGRLLYAYAMAYNRPVARACWGSHADSRIFVRAVSKEKLSNV